jgi:DNA-binding LacI/PurR family transcriptional regulator
VRKKITIIDIAAEAGVSVPTVSRVLNQREDVAPETRKRVEAVIKVRGYAPSRAARALGSGQSGQIDLVVPILDSDYILEVIRGIEETLSNTSNRLVLSSTHDNMQLEQKWVARIVDSSTDGALLLLPRGGSPYLEYLREQAIPFVVIDDRSELPSSIPSVAATNWSGGRAATEYLISLGHQRIAILCGPMTHISAAARLAGYRSACEHAGLTIDSELIRPGDFQFQSGYEQTRELLKIAEPPTAIFACSDMQATGVYRSLYDHGLSIPQDISVVGFDDIPFAKFMCPALTTIHQPIFEMGRFATTMLLRLIGGEALDSTRIELSTSVIVRESAAARAS